MKTQLDILVDRFLACPLPESVAADICTTKPGPNRHVTSLLTAAEAKEVLAKVLEGCSLTING